MDEAVKGGIMSRLIKLMLLCVAITAACCYAAYRARGYIAFGGEWMIWMVIVAVAVADWEEKTE